MQQEDQFESATRCGGGRQAVGSWGVLLFMLAVAAIFLAVMAWLAFVYVPRELAAHSGG